MKRMKSMKKFFTAVLTVAMTTALMAGCGNTQSSGDNVPASSEASSEVVVEDSGKADAKVGVVAMIENGAFTDMRDGIIEQLKAEGYTDANIDYQCASGDTTALSSIVSNMTDGTYEMVFTIATPPTQAFVNAESETPVFFCAVSAPVAAGILSDLSTPDKNATGTSNAIPVSTIFEFAQSATPFTKVGLIYSGNEDNATNTIKQAKEYLDGIGVAYVEKTASSSSDVTNATNSLVDEGVDVIFVPNDSIIQDGISQLVDICNENKIPTYASSATTVKSGCFATLAIDDKGIGKKTVEIAMNYVNGKKVAEIPAQVVGIDYCSVNKATMAALELAESDIVTDYEIKYLGE